MSARFTLLRELSRVDGLRSAQLENLGVPRATMALAHRRGLVKRPAEPGGNWTITEQGAAYLSQCCPECGEVGAAALRGRFGAARP